MEKAQDARLDLCFNLLVIELRKIGDTLEVKERLQYPLDQSQ
jgi:hypothetical protein